MLLVIHNLPSNVKYADIKSMIMSKCGITEVVLDDLVSEGLTKRVTVGLADDGDAAIMARKINGLYLNGLQLYVEDVRQKKESEQPYKPKQHFMPKHLEGYHSSSYQQAPQINQGQAMLANRQDYQYNNWSSGEAVMHSDSTPMMNMAVGGMYYVPPLQPMQPTMTGYMGYGTSQQMGMVPAPVVEPQASAGYGYEGGAGGEQARAGGRGAERGRRRDRQPSPPGASVTPFAKYYEQPQSEPADFDSLAGRGGRSRWEPPTDSRKRSAQPDWQDESAPKRFANKWQDDAPQRRPTNDRGQNFEGSRFDNPRQSRFDKPRQKFDEPKPKFDGPRQRAENPRQSFDNSRQSFDNPRQSFDNSRQSFDNPRQSFDNPRQSFDNPRQNFDNPRQNFDNPRSSFDNPRQSFNNPRQSFNNPRQSFDNARPKFDNARPKFDNAKPKFDNAKPKFDSARPKFDNAKPKFDNARSKFDNARPKFDSARPKFDSARPKFDGQNERSGRFENRQKFDEAKRFDGPRPNPGDAHLSKEELLIKAKNKDQTWRGQVASTVAKEVLAGRGLRLHEDVTQATFTRIKRAIRSRIDAMLEDAITSGPLEIVNRYRKRYPPNSDARLYKIVMQEIEAEQNMPKEPNEDKSGDKSEMEEKPKPPPASSKTTRAVIQAPPKLNKSFEKPPLPGKKDKDLSLRRLPQHPDSNKKLAHQLCPVTCESSEDLISTERKLYERKNQDEMFKELPIELQKAVEDELDVLVDLFMGECVEPADDNEKSVCEEIADVVSDEYRKVIRYHMTKRLLDMTLNLCVRAHAGGRVPPRDVLETFVRDYGAIALRKADRGGGHLFIVHVDSYENYDRLCALKEVSVSGISMRFKPMHITGPTPSAKEAREKHMARQKIAKENMIDKSKENILQPEYTLTLNGKVIPTSTETGEQVINQNPETGDMNECTNQEAQNKVSDDQGQSDNHEQVGEEQICDDQKTDCDDEEPCDGQFDNQNLDGEQENGDQEFNDNDEDLEGECDNDVECMDNDFECIDNDVGIVDNIDEDDLEDY